MKYDVWYLLQKYVGVEEKAGAVNEMLAHDSVSRRWVPVTPLGSLSEALYFCICLKISIMKKVQSINKK